MINDTPTDVAESIRESLDTDPETVVYAALDPDGSTAIFDVSDGTLDDEVKAIGLLLAKVAIQTDSDPATVAHEAAGLAKDLLSDGDVGD